MTKKSRLRSPASVSERCPRQKVRTASAPWQSTPMHQQGRRVIAPSGSTRRTFGASAARIVQHQVGPVLVQKRWQVLSQQAQVLLVARPVGEPDVHRRALLADREGARGVHREGRRPRLLAQDGGGAVALVHVQVYHQHSPRRSLGEQRQARDGKVVEGVEAAARCALRVVRPAAQVARDPGGEGKPRRQQRAGNLEPHRANHRRAPRQADSPHRVRRERTVAVASHVLGRVSAVEPLVARWIGRLAHL